MNKLYTTRYVNAISLICAFIIFVLICFTNKLIKTSNFKLLNILGNREIIKVQFDDGITDQSKLEEKELTQITTNEENNAKDTNTTKNETQENEKTTKEWYLEIPRIFLEAEISEGTSKEVMDVAIGHFEESSKTTGNICLAAHNRG